MLTKIKANFESGFTLAEVLITLVIVGVIAALTIPTLINNTQKNELQSQLKKTVSVTSQAIQKMKVDNGDMIYDKNTESETAFRSKFMKYFWVVCSNNCIDTTKYNNLTSSDNSAVSYYMRPNFITQDGSIYAFHKGESTKAMYITIDINGDKNPNKWGHDVFSFFIPADSQSQLLQPCDVGLPDSDSICNNSKGQYNGLGCTAKAIANANYFKNLPK